MSCDIRIGTSGWHYEHWRGPYYPPDLAAGKMLSFYIKDFDTVEINNSFYRLPSRETFEKWKEAVPRGFRFAVKANRFITHMKKLKDPARSVERFLSMVEALGSKLGPILFQLPPGWKQDTGRLAEFLDALPRDHRYSFEFRDPSWHTTETYELLRKHNASFCMYELAGFRSARELTANFAYVRLHGPGGAYQGRYSKETLRDWAADIRDWSRRLGAIYVYFDNDQSGYAAANAAELKELAGNAGVA